MMRLIICAVLCWRGLTVFVQPETEEDDSAGGWAARSFIQSRQSLRAKDEASSAPPLVQSRAEQSIPVLQTDLHVNALTEEAILTTGNLRGQGRRTYHVAVPALGQGLLEMSSRLPAVIMLHGFGSCGETFASEGSLRAEASRRGYLLAFIDGTPTAGSTAKCQGRTWNSGSCAITDADDVEFAAAVVTELINKYRVDPARVFVAGISNGGSMALRLACQRPDLFGGVAAIHGSLEFRLGSACSTHCHGGGYCGWDTGRKHCGKDDWKHLPKVFECKNLAQAPRPMLIVNGLEATMTDPAGGVYRPHSPKNESYPPLDFMFEHFAQSYGCGEKYESFFNSSISGRSTRCHSYKGCRSNVTTCTADAGDWWYGQPYDIVTPCIAKGNTEQVCSAQRQMRDWGPTTDSIDLSETILDFFAQTM